MRYGRPTPEGDTWEAAYVDDRHISQKLRKERRHCIPDHAHSCPQCVDDGGRLRDVELNELGETAYKRFGVAVNSDKRYRYLERYDVFGTKVEGERVMLPLTAFRNGPQNSRKNY